jgi:serine phosphatase RsbU (regulator of sigma subunit)
VWLADHQMRTLVHLTVDEPSEPLPVNGSLGGRAFIASEVHVSESDGRVHAWFPLLDGVDRIGVLEVGVADLPDDRRRDLEGFASVATAEIVTRGQYTDLFTSTRRLREMSLSAELQWQLLAPNSFSVEHLAVAGMMEPAYEIGGDSYDYAHREGQLQFAIFDAVGHDLRASLIATLSVTAYRHARRKGLDLRATGAAIDDAIRAQFRRVFTTGQLAELDTATGELRWLNAGHPVPLMIRHGQVSTLEGRPRLPFGLAHLGNGTEVEIAHVQLEPGDAVLLYTDGVIEAKRVGHEDFGIERLAEFLHTADAAGFEPAETLRRLSNAVLDFNDGSLQDDATTLLVKWRPEGG